jgi:hypothetical protein
MPISTSRKVQWIGALLMPVGAVCAQQTVANSPSDVVGSIEQQASPSSPTATTLYTAHTVGSSPTSDTPANWSGACTTCTGFSASGTFAGYVNNGTLGSSASLTVTGSPPANPAELYAETTSAYNDSLTIGGGTGMGVLALTYSLDGSLSSSAPSSNAIIFGLDNGTAPAGTEISLNGGAMLDKSADELIGVTGSQSDSFSVYVPFTYGTSFTITPWLWTVAQYPGGTATPYTSAVQFDNTMALYSAIVYGGTPGSLGVENSTALIDASSGLIYGPNGVSAVPLPATAWLLLSALGGLGIAGRLRRLAA